MKVTFIVDTILVVMLTEIISLWFEADKPSSYRWAPLCWHWERCASLPYAVHLHRRSRRKMRRLLPGGI